MTGDCYFTVGFELGKIVVFPDDDNRIKGVVFDLSGHYKDRPSDSEMAREFNLYLSGTSTALDFDVDMERESPFRIDVYKRVMEIPFGRTVTYGEIAAEVGRPGGARAIGQAMAANKYPLVVPCHRVVSGGGKIGGFSSGIELKRHLLNLEGLDY